MNMILKRPIVSEKSIKLTKQGWYSFLVEKSARKPVIARKVEDQFGVEVISVKTMNLKGEIKQQRGRRGYFMTAGFKKALVQLKKGQKISLFEAEAKVETADEDVKVQEKKSLLKGTKVKIEKEIKSKNSKVKNAGKKLKAKKGEK